ncbi:MAG: hypothetical protein A2010_08345 [Nitrospirae bacterium GWD2_57_9]|nr:MAG: hypothetical protein A2010_08345 [Nitrospirae bacterium GWD2_57_9]
MEKLSAMITGASGGIGQALCRVFQKAGYRVIGSDTVKGAEHCDVFIESDLRELCRSTSYRNVLIEQIRSAAGSHPLQVLINNAALQIVKPTESITPEDWRDTLDVNLVAPFLLAQSLLPDLERARGSVVNISSIHATLTKPGFVCYATSKTALSGLTRCMAVDLGARVRINAICPAAVATPMLLAGFQGKEKELTELSKMHPVERIAEPEEIADLALFLASQKAGFITGSSFTIDGGIGGRLHDPV